MATEKVRGRARVVASRARARARARAKARAKVRVRARVRTGAAARRAPETAPEKELGTVMEARVAEAAASGRQSPGLREAAVLALASPRPP
jgi:hypothetical protein